MPGPAEALAAATGKSLTLRPAVAFSWRASSLTLVAHNGEFALLLPRWQRATAGDGRLVLLSGGPGIGKSRLTAAFRETLEAELQARLRYCCSPHHQDSDLDVPSVSRVRA